MKLILGVDTYLMYVVELLCVGSRGHGQLTASGYALMALGSPLMFLAQFHCEPWTDRMATNVSRANVSEQCFPPKIRLDPRRYHRCF